MSSNLGVIVKKRESSRYYRTFSHLAQGEFPNRGLTNSQLYTKYSKCSDKNKHLTRRKRFLHLGAIGTALGSEPARTSQKLNVSGELTTGYLRAAGQAQRQFHHWRIEQK